MSAAAIMAVVGARPPVVRGDLSNGGVSELLRECERRRITGVLRFTGTDHDSGSVDGSIQLFGGEIAVDQAARDDGQDPVDLLLDLESGTWEVDLSLPPLPVSRGTALERRGSLAVHVPVDLMNYCEKAGLTGVLELVCEGRKAQAVYEAGELLTIELDGQDATDLHEVFAWDQGRFKITIDTDAPESTEILLDEEPDADGWAPAPPTKREDTRQFLRVVEMALVDVLDRSERARSPTRTSPPLPPPPKARPRPPSLPPPPIRRRREEQTVKLVFLSGKRSPIAREEDINSTRHVRSNVAAKVEVVQTEAEAPRSGERKAMAKKRRKKKKGPVRPAKKAESAPAKTSKRSSKSTAKPAASSAAKPAADAPAPSDKPQVEEDVTNTALRQLGGATAWALGVIALGVLTLYLLAALPPV